MTDLRRHLLEAVTLVVAAVVCATVSNVFASRERKVALVGDYPNALRVPAAESGPTETGMPAASIAAPDSAALDPVAAALDPDTPVSSDATALPSSPAPATPAATSTPPTPSAATVPRPGATPAATPAPTAAAAKPAVDLKAKYPPHPDKAYIEISGDAVAELYGRALFLDARRTSAYEQGHIAGARNFAVWEADVDSKVAALTEEGRDGTAPVVIYCSGGDCEDSHMLAQKLWSAMFNNVLVYKDGFPDWQKRGGAVRTGSAP